MKKISVIGATLLATAVLCAAPISLHQSLSLSVDKAQARIGRPLTPGSVAGVHRRHVRRTYRRGYYYGGGYYPYSYHGGHYRYRYHGHYYNHRGTIITAIAIGKTLSVSSRQLWGEGRSTCCGPFSCQPSAHFRVRRR